MPNSWTSSGYVNRSRLTRRMIEYIDALRIVTLELAGALDPESFIPDPASNDSIEFGQYIDHFNLSHAKSSKPGTVTRDPSNMGIELQLLHGSKVTIVPKSAGEPHYEIIAEGPRQVKHYLKQVPGNLSSEQVVFNEE